MFDQWQPLELRLAANFTNCPENNRHSARFKNPNTNPNPNPKKSSEHFIRKFGSGEA